MNVLLPVLTWWAVVAVLGWASLPLAHRLLGGLPDAGLGFIRPLGLLLAGYIYWLGGLSGLLPNNGAGAWFVVALLVAGGAWLARRDAVALRELVRSRWRLVLGYEALFLVAFAVWAWYRAYNPNIETAGGEKYMEMMFVNGVLRSPHFPPQDPWMSGHSISYYYFGYVIAALLIRLTGLLPSIGLTLVVPMTLGLALCGAFSLGYNLVGLTVGATRLARVATGAFTGLLLALVGSLHGFLELAYRLGWGSASLWDWLDIKNLTIGPGTCNEGGEGFGTLSLSSFGPPWGWPKTFLDGEWVPSRFIWWWRGSRVLHDKCGEVIHEFPFFSFLLADAHPHLLDLPFTLLVLTLALALMVGKFGVGTARSLASPTWLALPLIVGALGFLNAWDLPTFGFVVVVAYALWSLHQPAPELVADGVTRVVAVVGAAGLLFGLWKLVPMILGLALTKATGTETEPTALPTYGLVVLLWATTLYCLWLVWQRAMAGDDNLRRLLDVGRFAVWLAALAIVFYLPFHLGFRSQASGIGVVEIRSHVGQWLVHFGLLVFLGLSLLAVALPAFRGWRPGALGFVILAAALPVGVAAALSGSWVALLLVVLVALASLAALAIWSERAESAVALGAMGVPAALTFALVCLAVGLLLPLGTEFLFIRDLFGNRMNTIFKLYFQAWTLLSVAGGFAAFSVWRRLPRWASAPWTAVAAVLVLASLVYPVAAIITRTNHFTPPTYAGVTGLTLDGLAWWQDQYPDDVAAAKWLNEHSAGNPVIAEAPGGGYSHHGRLAMATGLQNIVGWDFHENQWRGDRVDVDPRLSDARALYTTQDETEFRRLMAKYDVRYLVVGGWERADENLDVSDTDVQRFERWLTPVFESGTTTIFQRD
jgi:uncharacterized membrane protein